MIDKLRNEPVAVATFVITVVVAALTGLATEVDWPWVPIVLAVLTSVGATLAARKRVTPDGR